jgi:metallo-beta-lactamase class B
MSRYRTIGLSILLLCCANLQGTAQARKHALRIEKLMGECYAFTTWQEFNGTPFPSNGLYLVTKDGVVMIDTPWDSTQFQPLLDSIRSRHGKKVVMCLSTHWHDDRTGGLEYYRQQGIRTYSTLMTDVLADQNHGKRAQFLITKDTTFHVGGYAFQTFYPGVGHTPDNIVVWFGKDRLLYGGCLVKSNEANTLGNLANADIDQWDRSIRRVRGRFGKAGIVVPGHQAWGGDFLLDHTLDLIREEEERRKEEDEEND